jgi:hypothetical protein
MMSYQIRYLDFVLEQKCRMGERGLHPRSVKHCIHALICIAGSRTALLRTLVMATPVSRFQGQPARCLARGPGSKPRALDTQINLSGGRAGQGRAGHGVCHAH